MMTWRRSWPKHDVVHDRLFLTMLVLLSVFPYVSRLGFYSDDWAFLGVLVNASDQSLHGLLTAQYDSNANLRMRPTQIVYGAALFKAFGLAPLGYHIVNAVVLASVAILLHSVGSHLGLHRTVALSISAVYVLLPNYATDRFWFAAFSYPLSIALFLGSTEAFLRVANGGSFVPWLALALFTLALSALGTEVVVPLAFALPVAVCWQWYRLRPSGLRRQLATWRGWLILGSPLAVIAAVAAYKFGTAEGIGAPDTYYLKQLIAGSATVNFGTYGVALPATVAWSLRHLPMSGNFAALLAALILVYLLRADTPPRSSRAWFMLVVAGFVVFGLGAAIFLTTGRVLFWSGGIANRVWIAAALGVALVAVGGAGWATSRLSNGWRRWAFSTSIAALCTAGFLINTALATYWIDAWPRQVQVIERIRRVLPQPQPGVTLILHGVCPYVGPAIVFESSWDLAGALRVVYRDPTLRADVTTGRFSVGDDGLETRIYTDAQFYPYDDDLLLYNDRTGTVVHVTDGNIARAHLTEHTVCAEGRPGRGTLVLPLDEWYEHLLSNDLLPPWR